MKKLNFFTLSLLLFVSWCHASKLDWHLQMKDSFLPLQPSEITSRNAEILKQRGLNPENMHRVLLPAKWRVIWATFPINTAILEDRENGAIRIRNEKKLDLFTAQGFPAEARLQLSCEVRGTGTLTLGFHGYGMHSMLEVKDFPVDDGAFRRYGISYSPKDIGMVRPSLGISGDLTLRNFVMKSSEDARTTWAEGIVTAISKLPDPAKSDYPDCYYTARFRVENILGGDTIPRDLVLLIPGFQNYTSGALSMVKAGQKLKVRLCPFDALSCAEKAVQHADDLMLFDLSEYFLRGVVPIQGFSSRKSGIPFSESSADYVSIYHGGLNPLLTPEEKVAREKRIALDQRRMGEFLGQTNGKEREYSEQFQKLWEQLQRADKFSENSTGSYLWQRVDNSFWGLPIRYRFMAEPNGLNPAKLRALQSFNEVCLANGIQFIVQLVPNMYSIAARVLVPELRNVPDPQCALLIKQLTDVGIEAIYPIDRLLADYDRHPLMFFYPTNRHPADGCQDILTDMVAERICKYLPEKSSTAAQAKFFSECEVENIYGAKFCWPEHCDIGNFKAGEPVLCRQVLYAGKPIVFNPASPVLVIGNSFSQTPTGNGSYPAYLARKLNLIPDYYLVAGFGVTTTVFQSFFNNRERYMKGKKFVVLILGADCLLAPVPIPDLRLLDENALRMRNQRSVGEILLQEVSTPAFDIDNLLRAKPQNVHYIAAWRRFATSAMLERLLSKKNRSYNLNSVALPDTVDPEKETFYVIIAAAFRLQSVSLTINGRPHALLVNPYEVEPQQIVGTLPPGTRELTIQLRGSADNTIVAIKRIIFFQKK